VNRQANFVVHFAKNHNFVVHFCPKIFISLFIYKNINFLIFWVNKRKKWVFGQKCQQTPRIQQNFVPQLWAKCGFLPTFFEKWPLCGTIK